MSKKHQAPVEKPAEPGVNEAPGEVPDALQLVAESNSAAAVEMAEPVTTATIPWKVWMHGDSPAQHNPMIVHAIGKDDAWAQFCDANKLPHEQRGPRVIRPALESEIPV